MNHGMTIMPLDSEIATFMYKLGSSDTKESRKDSRTPTRAASNWARTMTIMPLDSEIATFMYKLGSCDTKESRKDSRTPTQAASNWARTRVKAREYSLDVNSIRVTCLGILKL
ncbi:hypothetical protein CDL15_Pgr023787 [Punica granatum]|uniref:Uncharacterized protein n=1 Tax=Punica granatum TaxID=22663 RepID=A0A218WRL0_PUNGR|nr:hypothetical protein CDL15_Pgr023787 [Punica granatum]